MILALAAALPALLLQASDVAPAAQAQDAPSGAQSAAATAASPAATEASATTQTGLAVTDKNHPDFVRCRSSRVIGSLAKRTKTCMTNKEWEEVARTGNRGARDIVESQQVGMSGQ